MTIEEKAKAYDEALERAKRLYNSTLTNGLNSVDLEDIFPELCESEDERVRKELLDFMRSFWADHKESLPQVSRWVTYLEKQKEQKPAEYLPKEKVYDIMRNLTALSYSERIPINSDEYGWIHKITEAVRSLLDYPIEQKPSEVKDPFSNANFVRGYESGYADAKREQKPVVTHGETYHVDTLGTQQVIAGKMPQKHVHTAKEAWKEMRLEVYAQASGNRHEPNYSDDSTKMFSLCDIDEIFEKIGNSTVGSQPAEWSEEDERMWKSALWHIKNSCSNGGKNSGEFEVYQWFENRVKSLRPVKQEWSEDDEKNLKQCIEIVRGWEIDYDYANPHYSNWLKSLHLIP